MNTYRAISILIMLILSMFCNSASAQAIKFDPELAQRLGADEHGMKTYVFAVLKTGKTKIQDATEANKLQYAHLKNIIRLSDEGKMILAGPFINAGDQRGVYIFDVRTIDEAKKLVETDPAIKAGLFEFDLYLWYASAALRELSNIHLRIQKKSIIE